MDGVGINKEVFFFLRTRIKRIVMMLSIIISWDISHKEFYDQTVPCCQNYIYT